MIKKLRNILYNKFNIDDSSIYTLKKQPKDRYFLTFTGKKIYSNKIKAEDICLDDIAHHLSKICRYGGQLPLHIHYSVAGHSILLAEYALITLKDKELAKHCLLHDAAETYIGDMVNAVKDHLPDYKKLEKNIEKCIIKKYNLYPVDHNIWKKVKEMDTRILIDEVKILLPHHYRQYMQQIPYRKGLGVNVNNYMRTFSCEKDSLIFLQYCKLLGVTDD